VEHLKTKLLPILKNVNGYGGGTLLESKSAGTVETMVITHHLVAIAGCDSRIPSAETTAK
jgi:hypothetical protein